MRPKVRHVAVMTKNREKMVEFYQKVFALSPSTQPFVLSFVEG